MTKTLGTNWFLLKPRWKAVLKHDDGFASLIIDAETRELAIKRICDVENCPERSIIRISKVNPSKEAF